VKPFQTIPLTPYARPYKKTSLRLIAAINEQLGARLDLLLFLKVYSCHQGFETILIHA
jgi:hypothetical protein